VAPALAMHNLTDRALPQAMLGSHLDLGRHASRVPLTDRPHDSASQFGTGVRFSALRGAMPVVRVTLADAPLRSSVSHVSSLITQEQVGWVNARGVIATGAVVQDVNIGQRPIRQQPRITVGQPLAARVVEDAIAILIQSASPQPTGVSLLYITPEACGRITRPATVHAARQRLGCEAVPTQSATDRADCLFAGSIAVHDAPPQTV
jgi:hypothetical protein